MDILVDEELKAYIDPLTAEEYQALEQSILAEGCRDALVMWGDVLVDGHNRYGICRKHGLPFQTVQNPRLRSMQDVHLWMIDQHLGRRSVSDFQRGVLALRKREILEERRAQAREAAAAAQAQAEAAQAEAAAAEAAVQAAQASPANADAPPFLADAGGADAGGADLPPFATGADPGAAASEAAVAPSPAFTSREELARAARLSSAQVGLIEKIHKQAAPEVVAAVKAGAISLSAAATVATLPEAEQRAAALGGSDELKQAARRVREAKRKPRAPKPELNAEEARDEELERLRERIAELTAENEFLRKRLAQLQGGE